MRVYLSAPEGADLSVLRDVLANLDAEVVTWSDRDGTRWRPLHAWEDVDAAVVVLMPLSRGDYERTLIEAGIALGRQVPLLILTEYGLPSDLYQVAKVVEMHGILLNPEALRFHLSLFLKSLSVSGEGGEPWIWSQSLHFDRWLSNQSFRFDLEPFRARLEEIRDLPTRQTKYSKYEEWVADVFRAGGAEVAIPATNFKDRGFDFVVAMPDLDFRTGPLVVEVKLSSSPRALTDSALRLQYLVLQEQAGLGLLLFEDEDLPETFVIQIVPMVVSLGFNELVRRLEHETLAQVLIQARNEAVHGQ
jgi:hypothetical protein